MIDIYNKLHKQLTLENNKKYFVAWITKIDNQDYAYMINPEDYSDLLFCKLYDDCIIQIDDEQLFTKVMSAIAKEINMFYD